jgi:hypothetical protein
MAVALVELRAPPKHPPGEDMAMVVGSAILHKTSSEHIYTETGAPTVIPLFNIPPDTFIVEVVLEVTEVYNGSSAAMTIGDSDVDRYMDDTIAALGTLGFKTSKADDSQPGAGGFLFTAADTIDMTWTHGATGASTGACKVHIFYIRDWSKYN